MSKSDYSYKLKDFGGRNCMIIEDLDLGRMSVTNNIQSVIEEIAQAESINPVEYMIIYKDSSGNWDGYSFSTFQFIPLQKNSWRDAVSGYINHQLQN